jgi:uncharacterized membrane-anchored protein
MTHQPSRNEDMPQQLDQKPGLPRHPASKVPEVTALFWITKIMTTGMGETTSDFLAHRYEPVLVVVLSAAALGVALAAQLAADRYRPVVYWLAVVLVSVFGTMAADVLHVGLGIAYLASTTFFTISLVAVFAVWHISEQTLSIHSIHTRRRELFYWAAILTTFALGTAAGDLTASTFGLGYLGSGLLFAGIIAAPAIAWRIGALGEIAAFWLAYITTRPLGASFADWMGTDHQRGGLDWGTGPVSLTLGLLIAALVGLSAWRQRCGAAGFRRVKGSQTGL